MQGNGESRWWGVCFSVWAPLAVRLGMLGKVMVLSNGMPDLIFESMQCDEL